MEEEEKIAQSAKLQELIRRGNPDDLREANRLMKIMAGYDTRHRTDYRAKAAEEVSRVQEKAKLLEEMLENFKPGDKLSEGDVYEVRAGCHQEEGCDRYLPDLHRNWQALFKMHTLKYKRCARMSLKTTRPYRNY